MEESADFAIIILAAGKGTRMHSELAKVLHPVGGLPMIVRLVREIQPMNAEKTVVVVGYQAERVRAVLSEASLSFALQEVQLGTGHAVSCALPEVPSTCSQVLVLYGDTPLITRKTLFDLMAEHMEKRAALTVLGVRLDHPRGYGRLLLSEDGALLGIVEERDASSEEKNIQLVNTGIYCFDRLFLEETLPLLSSDNDQGEFYLTDLVARAVEKGKTVMCCLADSPEELMGINSPEELARAEEVLNIREKSL